MKKNILLLGMFILVNLFFIGEVSSAPPQILRIAMMQMPYTTDPTYDTASHSLLTYRLIYEPLIRVEEGKILPVLATSWKQISDVLWEIKLREGVKFHDGNEFNAHDVKFGLDRVLDPKMKSQHRGRFLFIESVDVVDKNTVRISTKQPVPILMNQLAWLSMLPSKLFDPAEPDKYLKNPIGTGPYQVTEWIHHDHVTLKSFEGYWRGKSKIDKIVIRHMPESSTRVAALETKEVDIAHFLPPEHAKRMEAKGFKTPWINVGQIFNVNLKNTMDSPLKDKRVRQAINYAIDKDVIIENLMLGYGRKLNGQISGPEAFGYHPALKAYPYDLNKAKQLLREAGYPNGFSVHYDGTMGRYPKDKEITEIVIEQLNKIGIKVDLAILESSVWSRKCRDGTIGPMYVSGWMYSPGMDVEVPLSCFQCAFLYKVYCNNEFDKLFKEASGEMNPKERLERLHKMAELFREEAPIIFLHQISAIYGVSPRVKGLKLLNDFTIDVINAYVE